MTLVAILDADKEGFLRGATSLVQTIGRAARNSEGRVIMYADRYTDSPCASPSVKPSAAGPFKTAHNEAHGIVPKTIVKSVRDVIEISSKVEVEGIAKKYMSRRERIDLIEKLTKEMRAAAKILEFEHAAYLRDRINELQKGANKT